MSIEHRWTPRQPARLSVSIACRPLGLLRGRLRNISNGGAMVQLRAAPPPNAPVELILPLRVGTVTRSYRLPAIVTRSTGTGVGLMFGRVEPDTWAALLAHLRPRAANDANVGDTAVEDASVPSRS